MIHSLRSLKLLPTLALLGTAILQADPGGLTSIGRDGQPAGECPLKHTTVKAEITGFLSRVNVTQEFENKASDTIEAVYTFPLPPNAAVDDMTMLIGDRTVKAVIKTREEARKAFEEARQTGRTASLLDEERPNIFTQAVTNIPPHGTVKINISYVAALKFEDGAYEFNYPMVVAPRYMPGQPVGRQGGGWSPDTRRVPDASRISPPVTPKGTRAGHDISIEVTLDAGVPIDSLQCPTHEIDLQRTSIRTAHLSLKDKDVIPNKDFILKYDVLTRKIEDAVLTTRRNGDGFFTLMLTPPERVTAQEVAPKELVFVIDTSGSMMGFPIEKAKESMKLAMDALTPADTFNLITFSGDTHILFPQPVHATPENLRKAQQFLLTRTGSGGTEMMKAIRAALDPSDKADHVRIVCFMTDGEVGNDMEILSEIQRHPNARVFSFGIGSSVNRFLLDNMARYGRGEVEYVGLNDDGSAAAKRFHERVRNPVLTDVSIDWNGLPVTEVYPQRIPDLFSAKPLVIMGRYTRAANGVIRIKGTQNGHPFVREVKVNLPDNEPQHGVLATLWARTKVEDLMSQDWMGMQRGTAKADVKEPITQLGLKYRLMTQFTSFVAVEDKVVNQGGQVRHVQVPVEMPEGMSYEGVFGEPGQMAIASTAPMARGKMMMYRKASPTFAPNSIAQESRRDAGTMPEIARPSQPPVSLDQAPAPVKPVNSQANKLHPSLAQAMGGNSATAKLAVKIWVTRTDAAALAELQKLGFELQPGRNSAANLFVGRIAAAKLNDLIALANVRFVEPQ